VLADGKHNPTSEIPTTGSHIVGEALAWKSIAGGRCGRDVRVDVGAGDRRCNRIGREPLRCRRARGAPVPVTVHARGN